MINKTNNTDLLSESPGLSSPSEEQIAIMKLVMDGKPMGEIVKELNIKFKDATAKLKDGMKKIGARNLYDLILWGLRSGIIKDPPLEIENKFAQSGMYEGYPAWLQILNLIVSGKTDPEITKNEYSKDTLNFYKEQIKQRYGLGPSDAKLIRFAFQVLNPISPPKTTLGWKPENITPIQNKIIHLIARGYITKEIADMLNIDERTVSYHMREIKKRLNLPGRGNEIYSTLTNLVLSKLPHLSDERPSKIDNLEDVLKSLTSQQVEVMKLLVANKNTFEISKKLNISPKTVEYHRKTLFDKLKIYTRSDLVAIVKKYNLFTNSNTQDEKPLTESPQITQIGKLARVNDQPLKNVPLSTVRENMVFIRQQNQGGFIPEGWSVIYFMDTEEAANMMANGKMPYLLVPRGTFSSGGSPITDIWKKRFQKPGHEHILGVLEGNTMPDNVYIDMITVRSGYRRNSIAKKMVELIKQEYPNAKITYSSPTDQGRKFFKSQGDLMKEGNNERRTLDMLADNLNWICKNNSIKLLQAKANRDEFDLYVYDFTTSKPIPDHSFELFSLKLKKMCGATVKQSKLENGQNVVRIII